MSTLILEETMITAKGHKEQQVGKLRLKGMPLGMYQTNAYIAWIEGQDRCWIFDAPFEAERIVEMVREHDLTPEMLLLTHAHLDHIGGVETLRQAWPELPILIHERERDWLGDPRQNLSLLTGRPVTAPEATRLLTHGEELTLGKTHWRVLHVPGHSPGSVGYYCEQSGVLIGGDALFKDGIGRTDFPGCSQKQLLESIRREYLTLPDETKLFPGHGLATTIGHERAENQFLVG